MNTSILSSYPEATQKEVLDILSCFDRCEVSFYNGNFHVSQNYSLLSEYPEDFIVLGNYKNSDIYTKEEILNNIKKL